MQRPLGPRNHSTIHQKAPPFSITIIDHLCSVLVVIVSMTSECICMKAFSVPLCFWRMHNTTLIPISICINPVSPELTGPSGRQYLMEGSPRVDFSYKETLGLPPPHSFTWLLNGLSFHGNSRIQLLNNNSTLSVRFVSRADSGNYTLTVASGSGNASLELDLVVTCTYYMELFSA